MKHLARTLFLAGVLGLAAGCAQAQNWEGPYVGAYGAWVDSGNAYVGGLAGYNYDLGGGFYVGAEVDGMYNFSLNNGVATAQGRVAYEVSPDVLLYGQVGAGVGSSTNWWLAGVGGEVMVMNNVSVRLGVDRYDEISGPGVNWAVKGGLAYHF